MSTFKTKYNPFSKSLQWVLDATLLKIRGTVDTKNDLPLTGNTENDCYIVKDTDKLYTWNNPSPSGTIDDWVDIGSSAEVDWSAITNKPSSSVEDIDDAVDKKHEQNTDTKLDEGGTTELESSEIITSFCNILLLAYYRAVDMSKTIFNLVNGFLDKYIDESGIDTVESIDASYNSDDDYYYPRSPDDLYLLLHLNGLDGATETTDSSPSEHTFTFNGTAQLDTAEKKWGTSSLMLDGNSDYINAPTSTDWDLCGSDSDDWTIDFWIKLTPQTEENFMNQYEDSSNYWTWGHKASNGQRFTLYSGASPIIDTGWVADAEITDSNWHHIALCKVADKYGIYVDGLQKVYIQSSATDTFNGNLNIGSLAGVVHFVQGYYDEIRISNFNEFEATPNNTPDDTIVVPTGEHSSLSADMTLISESLSAETEPSKVRIAVFEEDIDAITLNTDLVAEVSIDDGDNFDEVTLTDKGAFEGNKKVLVGTKDVSARTGTDIVYQIKTHNNKNLRIHGVGMNWD